VTDRLFSEPQSVAADRSVTDVRRDPCRKPPVALVVARGIRDRGQPRSVFERHATDDALSKRRDWDTVV